MTVHAGARLDRLPMSAFHRRILWLIGIGMFFDGFDIYVASIVLGATLKTGFSTLEQNAHFVALTFVGMTIGSLATGFLGDRFGRRFTYQVNLLVFGVASLASAFAPSMPILIACRFAMGIGLGAENVVGYATLSELVPPHARGRQQGWMSVFVVAGLPVSALAGLVLVPAFGWRVLFVLGGLGALAVWYARKQLPESPRWLAAIGRDGEAEHLLHAIEREVERELGPLPPAAPVPLQPISRATWSLFAPGMRGRLVVGCLVLIVINTLLYGFVTWLPTFFVKQGLGLARSFGFAFAMSLGAPIGSAIGAFSADHWGRRPVVIAASLLAIGFGAVYPFVHAPVALVGVGLALVIPIYVLATLSFAIYVPELFPTEIRLRASGVCNMFGRGATIATPYVVVWLFADHGVTGVLGLMIGLLILQIVAVAGWGLETRGRALEDVGRRAAARR